MKRFFIILVAVLAALTGFARATDNKTFERFYNLTPKQFDKQLNYYALNHHTDSAMILANIHASKYGKVKLSPDDIRICCGAYRYMGLIYMLQYYDYKQAKEYYLKAEQIAKEHNLEILNIITIDMASLAATQNDLETNFAYSQNVIDGFKKPIYYTIEFMKRYHRGYEKTLLEVAMSNLIIPAIKYDKTRDVINEVAVYRKAQQQYGSCFNLAIVLCNAVDCCNAGDYSKAYQILQTPVTENSYLSERDWYLLEHTIAIAKYFVLLKMGKTSEALGILQRQEESLREKKMLFELLEVIHLLQEHYTNDGNTAMSAKYELLYYKTKDEFSEKSHFGKMDEAKLNIELEQTRDRIQEMSYRQKIQTIVLWGAVIIALLAFALLGVMWVNYRKTRRTNKLLYNKNVALLEANKELTLVTTVTATTRADKQANDEPTQADRELLEKIKEVLSTSDEIYSGGFTRQRLAELVGVNDKYVSRAINSCSQGNFNALLNEYRIKEACHRLIDTEKYGGYSIEGIANSVGMSRGYFSIVFKEIVGLTPSAFQKMTRDKGTIPTKEEE